MTSAWSRTTLLALCTLAFFTALACSPQKNLWQSGVQVPGLLDKPMRVERLTARGEYQAAILAARDFTLEVFLPNDEACQAVFVEGAVLNYMEGAPGGVYQSGEWVCRSVGIGSLREWRDRHPRPRTTAVISRAQANYQLVYQDDEVAFLRGRFPLAGTLGFTDMGDAIAVVPKTPDCEAPVGRKVSSMEYYPIGKKVLTLVSTRGQCPIVGLILPLGGRPAAS